MSSLKRTFAMFVMSTAIFHPSFATAHLNASLYCVAAPGLAPGVVFASRHTALDYAPARRSYSVRYPSLNPSLPLEVRPCASHSRRGGWVGVELWRHG